MQVLSRSVIFNQSAFVDNQVAFEQQSIYATINRDDTGEVAYMMSLLDHLEAFCMQPGQLDKFCVLAYHAENKTDYDNNFSGVMVDFLTRLKIEDLYLLTAIRNDWKEYIFENNEKKKHILSMLNDQTNGVGFRVKVKDLPEILPLFFHAHPEYPHINLMPAAGEIFINLLLCKDGNLHTLFDESIHEQLKSAAGEAGLMMGSYEICHTIKNNL